MAFPDTSIGNQFPTHGEFIDEIALHARIDVPLDVLASRVGDGGWVTPALSGTWTSTAVSTSAVQYRYKAGVIFVVGGAKSGALGTVFTLPAGCRPLNTIKFTTNSTGVGAATISVSPAGVVAVVNYVTGGSNAEVNFNGVTFIAEQ